MVCGWPFSVTLKSSAFRPSIGLPLLSSTVTVSITSCELMENLVICGSAAAAGGVCCCGVAAGAWVRGACCAVAARRQLSRIAVICRMTLEPHPHGCLQGAHLVGPVRQA